MTDGDYSYRAEQVSRDEMGQLTQDFNHMAGVLEKNIHDLEAEVQAREDFIAAFSHELKTPLAILSADMGLLEDTYGEDKWLESDKISNHPVRQAHQKSGGAGPHRGDNQRGRGRTVFNQRDCPSQRRHVSATG